MTPFGIILLIIGFILFFIQRNQKQRLFSIKSARPMTAADLKETAGAVAAEIGGGSWRDYVKVWGKVVAETPLRSEHKGQDCVHFVSKVMREYEDKDENGKRVRKSETISSHRQSIPFWLHDSTGTIKVDPDGADIETIAILDELREGRSQNTLGHRSRSMGVGPVRSAMTASMAWS